MLASALIGLQLHILDGVGKGMGEDVGVDEGEVQLWTSRCLASIRQLWCYFFRSADSMGKRVAFYEI